MRGCGSTRATGEYRLFDDGSSNGTAIIRGGETIAVPPRDPRGVRVQSGDEVQVGRAVIKVLVGRQAQASATSRGVNGAGARELDADRIRRSLKAGLGSAGAGS